MNPEKYRRAKEIFWQAKELAPEELQAFLESASAGDPDLASEVRRLLEAERDTPDSFLEPPSGLDQSAAIEPGRVLGHFRIVSQIGQGGMGVVYRAEDTSLKRDVALKVLPADLAADPHRLERFQREAEAIAALNHPNIVTIYSIEKDGDQRFLTMELVEGESLDLALPEAGLPLARVLKIGMALADALDAAHEKGIVHRDLKPSNVMLTQHGEVKVLDFGLAKMSKTAAPDDAKAPTQLATLTREGVIVGTAAYMSPEQAQGTAVDTRSDIFSFGCLLYEAATGRRPFPGASSIDVLHHIIHGEPAPLTDWLPEAPMQLQWILRKCLAKAPEDRYQAAADLAVDLRGLGRDLDSAPASVASGSIAETPSSQPGGSTAGRLVAVAVAVAVVAVGIVIWMSTRPPGGPAAEMSEVPKPISIERLTTQGNVTGASISPDGNFFVYVATTDGSGVSLKLQQISGGQDLQLTPVQDVGFWGLTFSPDGSEIFYAVKSVDSWAGTMHRISTLGGISKQIDSGDGVDSLVDISPDGSHLAWYRSQYPETHQSSLMVGRSDGTEERILVSIDEPDRLAPLFYTGPGWSPDGSLIATTVLSLAGQQHSRLEVYRADTGELEWSATPGWSFASKVAWLPEGNGLLVVAEEAFQNIHQIWHVSYPEGVARQITNDFLAYRMISLSVDGSRLVTVGAHSTATIWTSPIDGSRSPNRISSANRDSPSGFTVIPDGRIVYPSSKSGNLHLAIMDADGTNAAFLTSGDTNDVWPRSTPDGQIVFLASSAHKSEIRRLDPDSGRQTVLATTITGLQEDAGAQPEVSPDGKWVIYYDRSTGIGTLWRVPIDGGTPEQLTTYVAARVAISPDSSRIAFYFRKSTDTEFQIGVAPITGGEPELILDHPHIFSRSFIRWSQDGEALLINTMPTDRANLWRLPLDGGEPQRLTDFEEPRLSWVEFHPDGETMIFSRNQWSRDAILIENFR